MSVYFDASLLVSRFTTDSFSLQAELFIDRYTPAPMVSDFAAAEFASAINGFVRMGRLKDAEATATFLAFDTWRTEAAQSCQTEPGDITATDAFLRRLDLPLRTPDALNIAIAQRLDLPLATFDIRMARSAWMLGVALAPT